MGLICSNLSGSISFTETELNRQLPHIHTYLTVHISNIRTPPDKCAHVQCHPYAQCHDGQCRCIDGYEGDGHQECQPKMTDECANIRCHPYAECERGRCICRSGYEGDGYYDCRPVQTDPCFNVVCYKNSFCKNGRCQCDPGYTYDPIYQYCRPIRPEKPDIPNLVECFRVVCAGEGEDPCLNVTCQQNSYCQDGRCHCNPGYTYNPTYGYCMPLIVGLCGRVQCHPNAYCENERCQCRPGFEGDGRLTCQPLNIRDPCTFVVCHPQAVCFMGRCTCRLGYQGDGHHYCRPVRPSPCVDSQCPPNAHCVNDRCQCKDGFEDDGYGCRERPVTLVYLGMPLHKDSKRKKLFLSFPSGIPFKELAQCVHGRCVCTPGFVEVQPGLCIECVQENCHPNAQCLPNPQYNKAYSCQCKRGFTGDGIRECQPVGPSEPEIERRCDGPEGCPVRNAECNRVTGKCECRPGYDGDGYRMCAWNCRMCLPDAECDQQNERCNCKPGYYGDGQTYCERIPTTPAPIQVHITGQGDTYRIADLSRPLELRCYVTTRDESITGQWIQPDGSQHAEISITRLSNGTELLLRISRPALTDVGRYHCRAGQVDAFIDVAVEETAIPYDIFLTSDDGILKVRSSGINSSVASLWNIAENNKYGRVAMVADCNTQRIIYTSDYGHSIRWGDANKQQKNLVTTQRFSLLYWASFTDGWMPNGTIQVSDMTGENEGQLIQLNGEPLALSISPSMENSGSSAGRLCWIQRSITNVFALATELHCARLSSDGRQVITQERLRQFSPTEEPSWGMVHHRSTVLWTDATRTVYYSANPAKRVHVRHVCCSNRFQAIAALASCHPSFPMGAVDISVYPVETNTPASVSVPTMNLVVIGKSNGTLVRIIL
ncbi:unnamed protein product [Echinostoma caproni]|uniref:EGF-like domain-containing protein n=1 Tax=Echinostoma caproni TaxID=27848 RepID=A0A183ACB0_9TREM|nr:unnamed protein product [Echinostoma caproni]